MENGIDIHGALATLCACENSQYFLKKISSGNVCSGGWMSLVFCKQRKNVLMFFRWMSVHFLLLFFSYHCILALHRRIVVLGNMLIVLVAPRKTGWVAAQCMIHERFLADHMCWVRLRAYRHSFRSCYSFGFHGLQRKLWWKNPIKSYFNDKILMEISTNIRHEHCYHCLN